MYCLRAQRTTRVCCVASEKPAAACRVASRRGCVLKRVVQGLGGWPVSALCCVQPAQAALHAEPLNALSLPTWAIHVSSTVEWGAAMYLVWRYAEVTGALTGCQGIRPIALPLQSPCP